MKISFNKKIKTTLLATFMVFVFGIFGLVRAEQNQSSQNQGQSQENMQYQIQNNTQETNVDVSNTNTNENNIKVNMPKRPVGGKEKQKFVPTIAPETGISLPFVLFGMGSLFVLGLKLRKFKA